MSAAPPRTGNAERTKTSRQSALTSAPAWRNAIDDTPEGTFAAPGDYETWADFFHDDVLEHLARRRAEAAELEWEARMIEKAWALGPTLELVGALLRGEAVPVELLNPVAVMRYGVRA